MKRFFKDKDFDLDEFERSEFITCRKPCSDLNKSIGACFCHNINSQSKDKITFIPLKPSNNSATKQLDEMKLDFSPSHFKEYESQKRKNRKIK